MDAVCTGRRCVRPTEYESWLFIHLKLVYHFQIHLYALQFSRRCLRFFKIDVTNDKQFGKPAYSFHPAMRMVAPSIL